MGDRRHRKKKPRGQSKAHIATAAATADYVSFRPGKTADLARDERIELIKARYKQQHPLVRPDDHPDPDDVKHVPVLAKNHRIAEVSTIADALARSAKILPKTFGDRVRELRARLRVSVRTLAQRTGIGKSTLYQIEDGNRLPRLDQIQRIALALNLAPTALVEGLDVCVAPA